MNTRQYIWNPRWQLVGAALLATVACLAALEWWGALFASAIATLAAVFYAVWLEPKRFRLTRRAIVVDDLGRQLDGLRIAHIGAVALGSQHTIEGLEWALATCAEMDVDLLVCSGPLLNDRKHLERLVSVFARFDARHGVYIHHQHAPPGSMLEAALLSLGVVVVYEASHNLSAVPLTISASHDSTLHIGIQGEQGPWPLLALAARPTELSASIPWVGHLHIPGAEGAAPLEDYAAGLATRWGRLNAPPGMSIITLRSPRARRGRPTHATVRWRHIIARLAR